MCTSVLNAVQKTINCPASKKGNNYDEDIMKFAVTLHGYSAKSYDFVRDTFQKALPHEITIRRYLNKVDASPGFTKSSLQLIDNKVPPAFYLNATNFQHLHNQHLASFII